MGYRIRFKAEALEQLDALYQYILDQDATAGRQVLQKIHAVLVYRGMFPQLGRIGDEEGVRRFVVGKTGLLLFYIFDNDEVTIVRVLHQRQDK